MYAGAFFDASWPYAFQDIVIFEPTCANARWALMCRFLSVRLFTHFGTCWLARVSKVTWVNVKIRVPNKRRWAHDNVKLLHLLFSIASNLMNKGSGTLTIPKCLSTKDVFGMWNNCPHSYPAVTYKDILDRTLYK